MTSDNDTTLEDILESPAMRQSVAGARQRLEDRLDVVLPVELVTPREQLAFDLLLALGEARFEYGGYRLSGPR
jgi:hypothetical protein